MISDRSRFRSAGSVTSTVLRGLAVALVQLLLLAGCTSGKKLSYTDTPARIDASGTARVAATAYDQRKVVTSGQESPTFIGKEWSLYHRDTVNTASGRPLGDDVTNLLTASLAAKGFKATPVVMSQSESPEVVAQRLLILRVDRGVVLTIADWRTDTRTDNNSKTQLFYDLVLKVLDPSGKVLAERRLAGHEDEIKGAARDAFSQKLQQTINAPAATQALSVSEAPAAAEPLAPRPPAAEPVAPRPPAAEPVAPRPPATTGQPPSPSLSPDV